ncbi:MAG TPA: cupin domain-containing protein [Acidimicrobiales bacterium]|nr:cupin domain-containing protein [Acidimicrobiales bacterium]
MDSPLTALGTNPYVYFYDEDEFEELGPGRRLRIVNGEKLSLWFWRIRPQAGLSPIHHHDDHEQIGFIARGSLEFSIGDDETQILGPGSFYLAPPGVPHGGSTFHPDPDLGEIWIIDVFSPPRRAFDDDRSEQ